MTAFHTVLVIRRRIAAIGSYRPIAVVLADLSGGAVRIFSLIRQRRSTEVFTSILLRSLTPCSRGTERAYDERAKARQPIRGSDLWYDVLR